MQCHAETIVYGTVSNCKASKEYVYRVHQLLTVKTAHGVACFHLSSHQCYSLITMDCMPVIEGMV